MLFRSVGFNPRTFINYTQQVPDSVLQRDRKYAAAVLNSENDMDSYLYASYRRYLNNSNLSHYLHVSDGGIAGNTGIEAVINEMKTGGILNKAINSGKLKRLIVVMANAATATTPAYYQTSTIVGINRGDAAAV